MKHFPIILIWLGVIIADGIVLPALTGLPSGFGTIVLLSVLAITFGIHRWVIGLGILIAGIAELIFGMYFGAIIGSWLIMAWGWHLLNRFLNMKPMIEDNSLIAILPLTLFGLGLFIVGEAALWVTSRFVYEPKLTPSNLVHVVLSPIVLGITAAELIVIFFIFRFIYSSRDSLYG